MEIKGTPFLRWAGSKRNLISDISKYIPITFNEYHEPFLGSGSVFFHVNKENSHLSDSNDKLINTYKQVRDNVQQVILTLKTFENNENFYYKIREHDYDCPIESAAQFIYLNKTCYNGLYRVNSKGKFNVPYGKRKNVDYISENTLLLASNALQNTNINNFDFYDSLLHIKADDLVFIDPPYVVSHNNNGFIEYNQKIFTWNDQLRLHDFIVAIIEKGAFFILTNAAHQCLLDLYSNVCQPYEINRMSKIGGKNSFRGMITEYLFTNVTK